MKTQRFLKILPVVFTVLALYFANLNNAKSQTNHMVNVSNHVSGIQHTHRAWNGNNDGIADIETANGISDPNSDESIIMATLIMATGTILVALYRFKSREHEVS